MTEANERSFLNWAVAALLAGIAFALYVSTLAPTVLAGDGGEFQFVPHLLGIAHPTGYPLYILLGFLWSHLLPVGDVAYRMNLFSAFWAALAVGLFYLAIQTLLRQVFQGLAFRATVRHRGWRSRLRNASPIAALTALTLAVTPTLWSQAVIAEVYGLHIFLVVLIIFLLLLWAERREPRFLLLAALSFGLGLAHHSTTLLLAPALVAWIWFTDRGVFRSRSLVLAALALCLAPLILYLYIPLRAPHTPYLRQPLTGEQSLVLYDNTLRGLVSFVLGGPFRGSVDLTVDLGQRLAMAGRLLQGEVSWVALGIALVGLIWLVRARQWALLAFTGLAYLATVAFNLVYTIGDIHVLYIPSYLIILLWFAVGVGTLATLASRWHVPPLLIVLPLFALPLWLAITQYSAIDQSQNTRVRADWETLLAKPLPPAAVLVSNDRNDIMPLWYFQYVDGVRPDLLGLFPLITEEHPTLGHVLDLALGTGRPAYLIKEMPGVGVKVDVREEEGLWRIEGPAIEGQPDYPRQDHLTDAVALLGYDLSPQSSAPGESLEVGLYWEALRPLEAQYHSFVHLLDAEGEVVAQSDQQPGGVFYPTTLWRPGERLRDDHELAIPADVPAGPYRLLAGMYSFAADGALEPLGAPIAIGQVAIGTD